ncbi:MAG TPA: sigma-54-dependent transcriptional regulator [Firmicutes bacterium]|nr:sigma-54-dependent transcriptional regulator [Candidatus Fermentithermobacillaceae bacterium]
MFFVQDSARVRLLDLILNATHDAIVAVDASGHVFVFNPSAEKILGKKASDVMGAHVRDVIATTKLDEVLDTGEAQLNQRQSVGTTEIITNRVPVRDESGKVVGAVAVFRDLTEVQNLAGQITNLREIQSFLTAIIGATQDAISVADANGNGLLINQAYTRLTGLTEKDVIGKPATVDIAEGPSMHMQVLRTRQPVKNVPMRVGPMRRQVVVSVDPVFVGDELKGSVGVVRDVSEIIRLTEELDRMKKIVRQLEAKYTFEEVVSVNPLVSQAVEQARRVASTTATVLLRGESGTGKELFAHAIHSASPRRNKPFVRVNCAALSESLLESELFGYVDGAFTGAKRGGRKGLFEEAEGGSLFLDEVGVTNLALQAKLLRVLQEKEIMRVGDSKPTPVNVRVIAATNVSLEQLVAEGRFREDLYYRLNVIPIFIPPLRQRTDDLPFLCERLLKKLNQEYGRSVESVSPQVMEVFKTYRWPGNVRELENVIGRAMMNMKFQETVILPEHLPPMSMGGERLGRAAEGDMGPVGPAPTLIAGSLREAVDSAERATILSALQKTGNNKTKAARLLGISLRSLYNKLERYGIKELEAKDRC